MTDGKFSERIRREYTLLHLERSQKGREEEEEGRRVGMFCEEADTTGSSVEEAMGRILGFCRAWLGV